MKITKKFFAKGVRKTTHIAGDNFYDSLDEKDIKIIDINFENILEGVNNII